MTKRVTVAVAADMLDDARSLAAYMDNTPTSLFTFRPGRVDSAGNPVWVGSSEKSDAWLARAYVRPTNDNRPEWDKENDINIAGAGRAFDKLVIWAGPGDDPDNPIPVPQSTPGTITAIAGMDGTVALKAMGVERVETIEAVT